LIDRRSFLAAGATWLLWPALRPLRAAAAPDEALAPKTLRALEASPFVYVSPLRADGSESTCHGEVWFAWIDGAVVINTAATTWKARAVARGLDRARIWVGDHGRWQRPFGRNEDFRVAPHFDARVERSRDAVLLDALLAGYERKYPDEIGRWRERMRAGFDDGTRWLLRYRGPRA
jgi:hypothetical protein